MDTTLHARATAVFGAVCELAPDERRRRVEIECAGDESLRTAVEQLLRGHADSEGFLDVPALGAEFSVARTAPREAVESGARRFGPYRLTRVIASGGFSVVYEAEQEQPRRTVALKVLRAGLLSDSSLRRFRMEAEVLGRLAHPGIAGIHSAGVHEENGDPGTPYFAMELVRGRPITDAAGELPLRGKLELFMQVCEAVQHAHQHGVIHRDLKPANILVDERGRARVLDFGVARVTNQDTMSMHTEVGALVGTVPYMSPEQVGGDPDEVDTRSDVYALGVVLFEMLAGRPPYDTRTKSIPEAARIIREQEPTRLGSIDTVYRGDLETIVSRALEKDASRRYASADALAADVRRYLENQPIDARPATRMYQARKFARRHPELIAGLCVAALVLLAGIAATSWGLVKATRQRDLARLHSRTAVERTRVAEAALARSKRLADSMAALLAAGRPAAGSHAGESAFDTLEHAAREISKTLADDPESELRFRNELCETFWSMAAFDSALAHARRADEIAASLYTAMSRERMVAATRLSEAYKQCVGTGVSSDAIKAAAVRQVWDALAAARAHLGNRDPLTVRILECAADICINHFVDDLREGEALNAELLEALNATPSADRPVSPVIVRARLALCRAVNGDVPGGARDIERAYQEFLLETDPKGHYTVTLPWTLVRFDRTADAVAVLRDLVRRQEEHFGRFHYSTMRSRTNLESALSDQGCVDEALALRFIQNSVEVGRWPRSDHQHIWRLMSLAKLLARAGRLEESVHSYRELMEVFKRTQGPYARGMDQECWRYAELSLGLRTFGAWKSDALRMEARHLFNTLLAAHPQKDLRIGAAGWDSLRLTLTKHGQAGSAQYTLQDVHVNEDPEPGVYRADAGLPVDGVQATLGDWVLIAPWHIKRYSKRFKKLEKYLEWIERLNEPAADETAAHTLTSLGWWDKGFGPLGANYQFGLVAEARFEVPPGRYRAKLSADDGGRVFLDGTPIIDAWPDRPDRVVEAEVEISPGTHDWRVEYVQLEGASHLRFTLEPLRE